MGPGAHDQPVVVTRRLLFNRLVGSQGPKKILRVKPASYYQNGRNNVFQVGSDVARLPIIVVYIMLQIFIPDLCLAVKKFATVAVPDGSEVQVEPVGIRVRNAKCILVIPARIHPGALKIVCKIKIIHEKEGSVVIGIVPYKLVRYRSLG